jgi:hypothetical protein
MGIFAGPGIPLSIILQWNDEVRSHFFSSQDKNLKKNSVCMEATAQLAQIYWSKLVLRLSVLLAWRHFRIAESSTPVTRSIYHSSSARWMHLDLGARRLSARATQRYIDNSRKKLFYIAVRNSPKILKAWIHFAQSIFMLFQHDMVKILCTLCHGLDLERDQKTPIFLLDGERFGARSQCLI